MLATVTGFSTYLKDAKFKVVHVTTHVLNDLTGLPVTVRRTYLCNQSFLFKKFLGKECEISLLHSPTLDIEVCTDIKEAKHEEETSK